MVQITLEHVSKHLTEEVIQKVFKLNTRSDEEVVAIEVTKAAPAGEGLISAVYRIKAIGNKNEATFIAKGLVSDLQIRKSLDCTSLFKREALFFSTILPMYVELQKMTGAKERIQDYLPICYGCHVDGHNDYILMEDLTVRHCVPMPYSPSKHDRDMTLKTIAHFHSMSLALRVTRPQDFNKISAEMDEFYYSERNREWYSKYLGSAVDIFRKVVSELEEPNSVYYKKFHELIQGDVYGQMIKFASTRGDNPVINHGDAWFPNFLFSDDKAIVIDFQLLKCASPAIDLSYFIMLCSSLCRNKKDVDEALLVYYQHLEYFLKDMGLDSKKIFSFETLQQELKKYGRYGVLTSLTTMPLMMSERCDVMQKLDVKGNFDRLPLEYIWQLSPVEDQDQKAYFINAVHIAVDFGLI